MSEQKHIGRYIVKGVLGEGAMGCVFKGYDPNLERLVAVKTMKTATLQNSSDYQEFKNRFFQESKVSGRLNHPHIVAVYDCGLHEKEPFIVMELIDGWPLDIYVNNNDGQSLGQMVKLLEQVASGLDFAHEEGVIHRDIKPGNILVASSKGRPVRAKLVDFGLAKLKDSKLTQTGLFLGTPSYSSPEQIVTGKVAASADLYAFGTVAYEMFTGRLPFEAENLHAILYNIVNSPPNLNLDAFAEFMDTGPLIKIFQTILQKDPGARYLSASEFVIALKGVFRPYKDVKCPSRNPRVRGEKPSKGSAVSSGAVAKDSQEIPTKRSSRAESQARQQFHVALKTKNLSSVRYCLQELKQLKVDTSEEETLLKALESEVRVNEGRHRKENRGKLIRMARKEFRMALETKNLQSIRYCLQELGNLGAKVEKEISMLRVLEQELQDEATRRGQERQRQTRVRETRDSFKHNFRKRDVKACRRDLEKLRAWNSGCSKEVKVLSGLEIKIREEREKRDSWIQKTRLEFVQAIEAEEEFKARRLLMDLESWLKVDVSREKSLLAEAVEAHRKAEQEAAKAGQIDAARARFQTALTQEVLPSCELEIQQLQDLGAPTDDEKKALVQARKEVKECEIRHLRENMTRHTRQNFLQALQQHNLRNAQYYLKELSQLIPDISREEEQLEQCKKTWEQEEQARLNQDLILLYQEKLQTALKKRDLVGSGHFLAELESLGAVPSEAKASLEKLKRDLEQEEQLHHKMIEQSLQEFENGLLQKDVNHCEHYLNILRELGADVVSETVELVKLKESSLKGNSRKQASDSDVSCKKTAPSSGDSITVPLGETWRVREKMEAEFRSEFLKAFKTGDAGMCGYHLKELIQLGADVSSETEALHLLQIKDKQKG